jgi:GTPase SAR1 family protein
VNQEPDPVDPRRVVVVGPCGSGKTTLVERLRAQGYDARVVAQEHSIVRDLWRRREPDVVVALNLDLATLRRRRSPTWSADILEKQHDRLRDAFAAADIVIDTGRHGEAEVVEIVTGWLNHHPR